MERIISLLILLLIARMGFAQDAYSADILRHRAKTEREFRKPGKSPFRDRVWEFTGNTYFPIDEAYQVTARIELTPDGEPFRIPTSNPAVQKTYVRYAILHFELEGQPLQLEVYRSMALAGQRKYKDHLFLPFTDLTTGEETYGGGRYLDLEVAEGETMEIDFNLAYNPYCAYRSDGWSCPLPPDANRLPVAVRAGVKDYHSIPD